MNSILTLCQILSLVMVCVAQVPTHHSNYLDVPIDHTLQSVVVIVRHGDRSQITRELGEAFYESNNLTHFWRSKLPSENTLRSLVMHQRLSRAFTLEELRKKLYAGWDFAHLPYGQLTEIGSGQLVHVGAEMRQRYYAKLFPATLVNASEFIHCRSTNICRTILSARSFLAGLLLSDVDKSIFDAPAQNASSVKTDSMVPRKVRLPLIYSRLKTEETMYPHADGPCWAMSTRRYALIKQLFQSPNSAYPVPSFVPRLEARLKSALGVTVKSKTKSHLNWMTWLNLMEIMICFQAHNLTLPRGVTELDVNQTLAFVTWKWGVLYKDTELVQFAIGRFIHELMNDILSMTRDLRLAQRSLRAARPNDSARWQDKSPRPFSKFSGSETTAKKKYPRRRRLRSATDSADSRSGGPGDSRDSAHRRAFPSSAKPEERSGAAAVAVDANALTAAAAKSNTASFLSPVPLIPPPLASTKVLFYAGHDATLVPLLVLLGIYNDRWPEYGAHLVFEFASINSYLPTVDNQTATGTASGDHGQHAVHHLRLQHSSHPASLHAPPNPTKDGTFNASSVLNTKIVIRVVYNNEPVMIPSCGAMWCPFPSLMDILKPYSMSHGDYRARCHNENIQ